MPSCPPYTPPPLPPPCAEPSSQDPQAGRGVCVCESLSHVPMSSLHVLCDPVHCSPPGSSIYGISVARILERFAISSSKGSSQLRDQACISGIGRQILYHCATWEALKILKKKKKYLYSTQLECTNYKEMILPFLGHCILLEMYP